MKKFALGLAVAVPCFALLTAVLPAAPKVETITGEIMDSQCAALNGHDKMIHEGQTEKECTNACVAIGGKYALYDAANKKAYQLDNQKMPVKFAGQKVKVTGDVDTSTNTIKVTKIEAAS
jgi:hypothetical protein